MNLLQSSPHRTLRRILRLAWDTSRGPRCFQESRSLSLPPSHLARAPTNPTGPRLLFPTRTPVHQEASIMDSVPQPTTPQGSSISMEPHHSPPRAKVTQRQRTITFRSPRSHTRTSTISRTLTLLPARDHLLNQRHRRPCTIPKTTTIRPSPTSSRIRRYPRYQVLLRVTPPPSSTIAAVNF
jgi:hypothetical protein